MVTIRRVLTVTIQLCIIVEKSLPLKGNTSE